MKTAIIIDDERHCCETLSWQIAQYCPDIAVTGTFDSAENALVLIPDIKPDLIFLDVEMPGMSGFDMLTAITPIKFAVIFTTAFNTYAIRAIRFGALDYLIKPIDKDELQAAVKKLTAAIPENSLTQVSAMLSHIKANQDLSVQKIALPTMHGFELVVLGDIVVCESNSNYTTLRLVSGKTFTVSRTLKEINEMLNTSPFFRIHHSYIVNLRYAIRYVKGDGGFLVVAGEQSIPVSRNKKDELLSIITEMSP